MEGTFSRISFRNFGCTLRGYPNIPENRNTWKILNIPFNHSFSTQFLWGLDWHMVNMAATQQLQCSKGLFCRWDHKSSRSITKWYFSCWHGLANKQLLSFFCLSKMTLEFVWKICCSGIVLSKYSQTRFKFLRRKNRLRLLFCCIKLYVRWTTPAKKSTESEIFIFSYFHIIFYCLRLTLHKIHWSEIGSRCGHNLQELHLCLVQWAWVWWNQKHYLGWKQNTSPLTNNVEFNKIWYLMLLHGMYCTHHF